MSVAARRGAVAASRRRTTGVQYSDDFNRTASSALNGSGPGWTFVDGDFQIDATGTKAQTITTSSGTIPYVTLGAVATADQHASAVITLGNGTSTGVVVRFVDAANWYLVRTTNAGAMAIVKAVTGTVTSIHTVTGTFTSGQRLGIRAVGSTISALVDGAVVGSVTDTSLTAGRRVGLRAAGATTRPTFDDFLGGDYP